MEQENDKSLFGLSIDAQSKSFLTESAKWGKFLAIIGFLGCVLIILAGIVVASQANELDRAFKGYGNRNTFSELGSAVVLVYILIGVIYFFPCLYLLRFSNQITSAMASDNQDRLTLAFKNLKSMFKFVGVFTIIIIAIYILAAVILSVSM